MSGIKIGPSANKYCNVVISNSLENILAYGCRNAVTLMSMSSPSNPSYLGMFLAYNMKLKVTTVSFCLHAQKPNRIVTGSDNGILRIWDVNLIAIESMVPTSETVLVKDSKILSAYWIGNSTEEILCVYEDGTIARWNFSVNMSKFFKFQIRSTAVLAAPSLHDSNVAAVGYKNGLIVIVDLNHNGKVLQKLQGHDSDIVCLSWCEKRDNNLGDLASTSSDGIIHVWNIKKGRSVGKISTSNVKQGGRNKKSNISNCLVPVVWVPGSEDKLVYGTYSGNVLLLKFEGDQKYSQQPLETKFSVKHTRAVYCIVVGNASNPFACSFGIDRKMIVWNLETEKPLTYISIIGGFVYCISSSFLSPNKVALGLGDGSFRIWDISKKSFPPRVDIIFCGYTKIISVAWHPENDDILAIGSTEGKTGIFNLRYDKTPKFSNTQHGRGVYSLSWGPLPKRFQKPSKSEKEGSSDLHLYSVGDGRIFIHDISALSDPVVEFDSIIECEQSSKQKRRCEASWKPDFTALAVGNENGSVEIYDQELRLLVCLESQKKKILKLRWHPMYTSLSTSVSSFNGWLACSSDDLEINVYDMTSILGNGDEVQMISTEEEASQKIIQPYRQLKGHKDSVTCVSWSVHKDGMLASSSYDGSVQIWDVANGRSICSYWGHLDRVFCVEWNPFDPDLMMNGGDHFTVHEWSISKQMTCMPEKKVKLKFLDDVEDKKNMKSNAKESKSDVNASSSSHKAKEEEAAAMHSEGQKRSSDQHKMKAHLLGKEDIANTSSQTDAKRINPSLLPLSGANENRGKQFTLIDHMLLAHFHNPEGHFQDSELKEKAQSLGKDDLVHLGLYGNQKTVMEMLSMEAKGHRNSGKIDCAFQLEVWKGNIGDMLRQAAEKRMLNDFMVALAPLASRSLWLEMCEKYAEQLIALKMYQKAVLYLLACHNLFKAIKVLKDNFLYREAIALAKSRLPSADPIVQELLKEWAEVSEKNGQIDIAIKCYLSLKDSHSAAKLLSKRSDLGLQKAAAYISLHCNRPIEASHYAALCLRNCLLRNEWEIARQLTNEQVKYEPCKLLINVHEVLVQYVTQDPSNDSEQVDTLFGVKRDECDTLFWRGASLDGQRFVDQIHGFLLTDEITKMETEDGYIDEMTKLISQVATCTHAVTNCKEILLQVSTYLTLAQIELYKDSNDSALSCCLNVLQALSLCKESKVFPRLCLLIFSSDLHLTDKMIKLVEEVASHEVSEKADQLTFLDMPWLTLIQDCFPRNARQTWMDNESIKSMRSENSRSDKMHLVMLSIVAYFSLNLLEKICTVLAKTAHQCESSEQNDIHMEDEMQEADENANSQQELTMIENIVKEAISDVLKFVLDEQIVQKSGRSMDASENKDLDKAHVENSTEQSAEHEDIFAEDMDTSMSSGDENTTEVRACSQDSPKQKEAVQDRMDVINRVEKLFISDNNMTNEAKDAVIQNISANRLKMLAAIVCSVVPFLMNNLYAEKNMYEHILTEIEQAVARRIASHIQLQQQSKSAEATASQIGDPGEGREVNLQPEKRDVEESKYDRMNLVELQNMRESVLETLQSVRARIRDIPFPDPLTSVTKIINVCKMVNATCQDMQIKQCLQRVSQDVAQWAALYCHSESQRTQFQQYVC